MPSQAVTGSFPVPLNTNRLDRAPWRHTMDINRNDEVYGRITRVINELRMARQSVTIFKVVELTGIDQFVVFQYFYENGLLRGK
jgi:hypothetical protein